MSAVRPENRPKVTLFDLDHTLLPIDSDHSWGEFTQQIGWTDPVEFKRRNDTFYAHYIAGTLDVHDYVRFAVEAIRVRDQARYEEAHARFMREWIQPALLEPALALVRQHQAADARGVFLSDEVMDFILTRFSRDMGTLMQLLQHLDAYALQTQRAITIPLVKSMLEDQ